MTALERYTRKRNARHEGGHAYLLWQTGLHVGLKPDCVCVGVQFNGQHAGGFVSLGGPSDIDKSIASGDWMNNVGKVDTVRELCQALPEFAPDCISFSLAGYAANLSFIDTPLQERIAARHSFDAQSVRDILSDLLGASGDAADQFVSVALSDCLHREIIRHQTDTALSDGIERLATWLYDRPNGRASWAELESFLSGSGVAQLPPEQTNNAPMELQNEKEITL